MTAGGIEPTTAARTLMAGASVAVLVTSALKFLPFMADDALISLRYSERLLAGRGLTWTDGERVEGYSNLLWVLATAVVSPFVPGDLVTTLRVLGVAGMAFAVIAPYWAYARSSVVAVMSALTGGLVLTLPAPIGVWAVGGLEQALVVPLVAWALALLVRAQEGPTGPGSIGLVSALLGLLCLTRPDGALLAGGVGLGWVGGRLLARESCALRELLRLAAGPVVCVLGQLAFRLAYYGDWVPNTAHAKLAFTPERFQAGWSYIVTAAWVSPVLPLAAACGVALLFTRRRGAVLPALLPFGLWTAYVALVGGDIFPALRHLLPLYPLAAFLIADAVLFLAQRRFGRVNAAVLMLAVGAASWGDRRHPEIRRADEERWEWVGKVVAETLGRAHRDQRPLFAVDAAGCLPFFSKLPALDLLGLNDRFLAKHPPPDFGKGAIGHELGNGRYAFDRSPDLISFCTPPGNDLPCFRSGREMYDLPEFHADYQLTWLGTTVGRAPLWVRKEGRIGLRREPGLVRIPGHLLGGAAEVVVVAVPDGSLRAQLLHQPPASLRGLRFPAGSWGFRAEGDGDVFLRATAAGQPVAEGMNDVRLDLAAESVVSLEARAPPGKTVLVSEITARRGPRP